VSHDPSEWSQMSQELGCPPPEHSPRDDLPFTEEAKQMEQSRPQSTLTSLLKKNESECSPTAGTRSAPPLVSGSQSTLTPLLQLRGQSECSPTGTEMQTQTQHSCSVYHMRLLRTTYAKPLEAAAGLLHTVDKDLAGELYRALSSMDRLLVDTASAITGLSCVAQAVTVRVLPVLRAALVSPRTRRTTTTNSIGIAQALVAEPQKWVAQVLHNYILLVERVYYIHRCARLALDSQQELQAEQTGLMQGDVWPSGQGAGEALGCALVHLDQAIDALEECSDFWRMLRRTSNLLASIAESAHSIRGQLLSGPKSFVPQLGFEPFVDSLDHFCQRQLSLDQFCQHYCPKYSVGFPRRQQILHTEVADDDGSPSVLECSCATPTHCGAPSVAASSAATSRPKP